MSERPNESLLQPDWSDVPVVDDAEPADADTDHTGPDDYDGDAL